MSEFKIHQYPEFYDAVIGKIEFYPHEEEGPSVTLIYHLLGENNDEVVVKIGVTYHVLDPSDQANLAIDLRRLGWELPYEVTDLPRIVEQIGHDGPLVEVAVGDEGDGANSVTLVKRYCG